MFHHSSLIHKKPLHPSRRINLRLLHVSLLYKQRMRLSRSSGFNGILYLNIFSWLAHIHFRNYRVGQILTFITSDEYQRLGASYLLIETALLFIIILRIVSGSIDITAAMFMLKFNDLEKAFYINTLLALVGPCILIITTGIALVGLSEKISLPRMICLFGGIILILISLKSK